MDSDDSRDSSSSDSEADVQNEGPRSPESARSTGGSRSRSNSPGPRSPPGPASPMQPQSPDEPRSPSPESQSGCIKSPSPGDNRSRSVNSINSSPGRNSPDSYKSAERRSQSSDRRSNASEKSIKSMSRHSKSPSSDRESIKSNRDVKSPIERSKSRSSVKSRSSGGQSPRSPSSIASAKSENRQNDDGETSDSSLSSCSSNRRKSTSNGPSNIPLEAQAEEISDGEMDLDGGKDSDREELSKKAEQVMNISHEDLSDVSDLDSLGGHSDEEPERNSPKEKSPEPSPPRDLRQKIEKAKTLKLAETQKIIEKTSKTEDGEEALDFEAEDGECEPDPVKADGEVSGDATNQEEGAIDESPEEDKPREEPEEGEVTDDDEARPEETEPRPVCRFYSRGQCTWGASCRFLHPGVTDKGNYTMFEMIRPVVPGPPHAYGPEFRDERGLPFGHPLRDPPQAESAWERGLRTAKEMVRRAIKRKEQDMDFEEKKMNLTLSQDELDKENGYYTRTASPVLLEPSPPPAVKHYVRHPAAIPHDPYYPAAAAAVAAAPRHHPEEYYRRVQYEPEPIPARQVRIEPEYEAPIARERIRPYRELPAHKMPDYYDKYEERTVTISSGSKVRPKREVIVQRVEASGSSRGDEWADPWMRSKSPGGRRGGPRRQSYSSGSSYSSSSSSASSRSSAYNRHHNRSRSRTSSPRGRRRAGGGVPTSPSPHRHRGVPPAVGGVDKRGRRIRDRAAVSPSVIVSERKAAHERALLMNPPAPSPRKARPPSPGMMRTSAQNPPAPIKALNAKRDADRISDRKKLVVAAALAARVKSRVNRSSRSSSGSDSSGSSSSDSESSYSSSSSSRENSPSMKRKATELAAIAFKAKAIESLKGERAMMESKKRPAQSPPDGDSAIPAKLAALSKSSNNAGGGKKSTSRREELLKQLKAVEDAIAKKRSKIN